MSEHTTPKLSREERVRRRLPHWDVPGAAYFVTTCLEGSIPARGLLDLVRYRDELVTRTRPVNRSEQQWVVDRWKLAFARVEEYLDDEPPVRWLDDTRCARIVADAVRHFDGVRYDLLAFVVMPSHIHWVFHPLDEWAADDDRGPRERILQSVNRFTSRECNRVLDRAGAFWQHESYDHWVRDEDELERIVAYVEGNPVKAGLVARASDWPFSSATGRREA
jgi:putative transposase